MRIPVLAMFVFLTFSCKKNNTPSKPIGPSVLKATAVSTSQINLNWSDNSNNEEGFKIERKTGSESFKEIASVNRDVATYSDGGLTKNTTYTYRVIAYNSSGNSGIYTNDASATTFDDVPITTADLSALAVSTSQINLAWTDKATNETGYKIERKTGAESFSVIASINSNAAKYNDTGLKEGTIYTYRIYPFNEFGNGNYSNEAVDTTFTDVETGLVAYYPFNGNANDETGNGSNGTTYGVTLTTDRFNNTNKAYRFNGYNTYINVGNRILSTNSLNCSYSLWVLLDSLYIGGRYSVLIGGALLTKRYHEPQSWSTLFINSDTVASFGVDAVSYGNFSSGGANLLNKKWNHLVGVREGNKYSLFVNGILVQTIMDAYFIPDNFEDMRIGMHAPFELFFYGKIDDIRIYNRPLTPSQVLFLFNKTE